MSVGLITLMSSQIDNSCSGNIAFSYFQKEAEIVSSAGMESVFDGCHCVYCVYWLSSKGSHHQCIVLSQLVEAVAKEYDKTFKNLEWKGQYSITQILAFNGCCA